MNFIQKKQPNVKEEVRDAQKVNRKGVRELEQELRKLDREEAQLLNKAKAAASRQPESAKVFAKQVVKLRQQRTQMTQAIARLQGINAGMKTNQIAMTSANAMQASAVAMGKVNAVMDPARIAATAQQFQKQSAQMEMASEVMDDALEGMFEGGEDEADELVDEVLDQLGIDAVTGAVSAPKTKIAQQGVATAAADKAADDEIDRLMQQLKA